MPAHGELYVRAIDRACNVEAPYQVVVLDDAPGRPDLVEEYRGLRSERIVATLPAGRYLLEVSGHDGAHAELHDYRLNVTRLGD